MKLIMEERGNGFPDIGDLVGHWDESGNQRVWRVTRLGRISTGGSGYGNTLDAHGDELDGDLEELADAIGLDIDRDTREGDERWFKFVESIQTLSEKASHD